METTCDLGITRVILGAVKTAVSLPGDLFESAERYREAEGLSRSELYANALREFLADRSDQSIREQLNTVYPKQNTEPAVDPVLAALQAATVDNEEW